MSRIGVFICHCGENIGATVDCIKVTELAANMEGVAYAVDYKYMCSDPGQTRMQLKNMIWMVWWWVHVLPVCMNRLFVGHVLKQP